MRNRNCLSPDFLALFENRVRSVGVWCDTRVKEEIIHKYIAKNPNSMLAISLCGLKIARIEKLHENVLSRHCLVCELFTTQEKEAHERLETQLTSAIDKIEQIQTQDKEK